MRILVKGGQVVDPINHINDIKDVYIDNHLITHVVEPNTSIEFLPDQIIIATGLIVSPGLIDMHVHLRDPGQEYKETIETGCKAASAGGFTAICSMPNTKPIHDNVSVTTYILNKAKNAGYSKIYPVAAISQNSDGNALCEFGDLKAAGVVAFSDDGKPVKNSQLMRRALEYAKGFNMPILSHCEECSLSEDGVMNEGLVSTQLGLAGISNAAETIMVMRDIALSELTGAALHIMHVSTAESVRVIRDAKNRGVNVTAETAPHYFSLTDEAIRGYNTNAKMNPPLRTQADQDAIKAGLADGTIDAIATDHAPHSSIEKETEFNEAANGIIGLETALPLSLVLVDQGILSMTELINRLSVRPSQILNLPHQGIRSGNIADLTIIDPNLAHTINSNDFYSKSRNTPFNGWHLKGKAVLTMVEGKIVYRDQMLNNQ